MAKQPLVNLEEKIDKVVGRRLKAPDALSARTSKKADSIAWRKAFGGVNVLEGSIGFAPMKRRTTGYGG